MQKDNKKMESFFDDSWTNMHGLLEEHFPIEEKRKKRIFIWWWLGSAVAILLVGWLVWAGLQDNNLPIKPQPIAKQIPKIIEKINPTSSPIVVENKKEHPLNEIQKTNKNTTKANKTHLNSIVLDASQSSIIENNIKPIATDKIINSAQLLADLRKRKIDQPASSLIKINASGGIETDNLKNELEPKNQPTAQVEKLDRLPNLVQFLNLNKSKESVNIKNLKRKQKKFYVDLYTDVAYSFKHYNSYGGGLLAGYQLSPRFGLETGIGYRTVVLNKALSLQYYGSNWDGVGSYNSPFVITTEVHKIQLHNLEIPLNIKYQMTPRFGVLVGGVFVHQLKAKLLGSNVYSSQELLKTLSIKGKGSPNYFSVQSGVTYKLGRFQLGLGYKNRSFPSDDHQVYGRVFYRLIR